MSDYITEIIRNPQKSDMLEEKDGNSEVEQMRLNDLLEQEVLKGATAVAGEKGLMNQVTSVTMMDAPDIADFVKQDQLLLTTGYHLQNNPDLLMSIVIRMTEEGCAGLGLKVNRFLDHIPPSVIDVANEGGLPVIALPDEPSLGDMVNSVLKAILDERTQALSEAMAIHRRFTDLIVGGKGLYEVLDQLSRHICAPVLLLDYRLNLLESSRKFDEDFCFVLAEKVHEVIQQDDLANGAIRKLSMSVSQESEKQMISCCPVQMNVYQKGYLIVFLDIDQAGASERLAVEQAMNVIAFELMKLHAVEQQEQIQKNEFLTEYVEGRFSSEKDLGRRGEGYGLRRSCTYLCVAIRPDHEDELYRGVGQAPESERRLFKNAIYEQLQIWFDYYFDDVVFFSKNEVYVALIPKPDDEWEDWLMKGLVTIQKEMEEFLFISISFGIGNPAAQLLQVPDSFKEALETLHNGRRMGQEAFIKWTDTKGVTELLRTVSPQKLREFYESTLKSLVLSSKKEDEDLIKTLTVYLEHNGQIAETAKALFVHRNTVIYRLKKCEDKLQVNLKHADDIHKLRTALLVREMIE
ncbi:PucR family transcriptional regulator [Salisediminibacterium selenitireducens]|nr:PucR family transcriptional regulator [Salisediminibacterium selenitireducens]